ncbi:unnamed protein product [Blepharisma stoltei]|uniref:Biogenesis of lysosome-related organelles complex 1 subunit 6 n=1 Tax=Blepharisma stoltei TaxID=1481888 RepID=A0AAU9IZM4_9CILI|nr:unnamed protein product [Blepharisma stoltei]
MLAQGSQSSISIDSVLSSITQQCSGLLQNGNSNLSDLEKLVGEIHNNISLLQKANESFMQFEDEGRLQNEAYSKILKISNEINALRAKKDRQTMLRNRLDSLVYKYSVVPKRLKAKKDIKKIQKKLEDLKKNSNLFSKGL